MDEELIKNLEATGKYQVIHRYEKPEYYHEDDGLVEKFQGLFVDCETTGLSHNFDRIIEIGLLKFEFSKDGRIFKIYDCYTALEDPKVPLSEKIVELTGLSDSMLAGKSFNVEEIDKLVEPSHLIVCHNAFFDRQFLEKRFPIFITKSWACLQHQIPWEKEGFSSQKLEFLAYRFKFFYDAHRAEADCFTGLHILSKTLPKSGNLVFDILIKNARSKSFRIWAVGSGFDKKDLLRNRGYKWFPGGERRGKSWYIEIDQENLESELEYLRKEIYQKDVNLPIDTVTAVDRFSERI